MFHSGCKNITFFHLNTHIAHLLHPYHPNTKKKTSLIPAMYVCVFSHCLYFSFLFYYIYIKFFFFLHILCSSLVHVGEYFIRCFFYYVCSTKLVTYLNKIKQNKRVKIRINDKSEKCENLYVYIFFFFFFCTHFTAYYIFYFIHVLSTRLCNKNKIIQA